MTTFPSPLASGLGPRRAGLSGGESVRPVPLGCLRGVSRPFLFFSAASPPLPVKAKKDPRPKLEGPCFPLWLEGPGTARRREQRAFDSFGPAVSHASRPSRKIRIVYVTARAPKMKTDVTTKKPSYASKSRRVPVFWEVVFSTKSPSAPTTSAEAGRSLASPPGRANYTPTPFGWKGDLWIITNSLGPAFRASYRPEESPLTPSETSSPPQQLHRSQPCRARRRQLSPIWPQAS